MNAMQSTLSLDIRPAIAAALEANRPVVAMVSSPLSQTLPWPNNLEAVRLADDAVRQEGATLAVVAVWKGRLTVGLEPREVEGLTQGKNMHRASRRDLAAAIFEGWNAGTTVSATMFIAARAGIRAVITGAIGTARPFVGSDAGMWHISSDLVELSHTPVAVISSGTRSVSHMTYAMEVLDTFRVPVVGYRTDSFPTFYMGVGSSPVTNRVNTPAEAAAFLKIHWGIDGAGVVLAQPAPAEVAISPDELFPALRAVEEQAEKDRVAWKDFSPFLMDKLNRLTWGKALRAYQAILVANARLGAQIARELNGTS
jgi:pseudouridylate synthase